MPESAGSRIARGNRVQGKVALVTGAAQGIGRACAVALAAQGARVAICDIQQAAGEAAAESIRRSGGEAVYISADVGKEDACRSAIEQTVVAFGGLDVLVNNAAISPRASLTETSAETWDEVMAINLRGPFLCCKYAIPHLARSRGASIINIGSIHGESATIPGVTMYVATKFAVHGFTRGLSRELGGTGITVNAVQPGFIDTELSPADGHTEEMKKLTSVGRFGRVEEIASAVAFLAHPESAFINGENLTVDGGWSA